MTRWVETPEGGRDRGPRGLARAWFEVMVRPRRFFRAGIAPGDQAPGLTFLMGVVLVSEATRYLLVAGAYPSLSAPPVVEAAVWLGIVVLLVAPLALHLVAALQTVLLALVVEDRAGISQTVQVLAYASAPGVVVGVPIPEVRVLAAAYGALLLVLGLRIIHDTTHLRAAVAGAIPAAVVFGYGFRGFAAARELGLFGATPGFVPF